MAEDISLRSGRIARANMQAALDQEMAAYRLAEANGDEQEMARAETSIAGISAGMAHHQALKGAEIERKLGKEDAKKLAVDGVERSLSPAEREQAHLSYAHFFQGKNVHPEQAKREAERLYAEQKFKLADMRSRGEYHYTSDRG